LADGLNSRKEIVDNTAKLLLATLGGTLLLIIGVSVFFSGSGVSNGPVVVEQSVLLEGATNSKGADAESAEVTIVEFSDFECPACASVAPVLDDIVANYPQVRVVYRHYPLISIHRNAVAAGTAAEAAAQQGKFWEMHDSLFATQPEWSNGGNPDEIFFGLARDLNLDEESFRAAYKSAETRDKVMSELRLGETLRVGSTPTLYYNGELMDITQIVMRLAQDLPETTEQLFQEATGAAVQSAE
jgi:protein-disulfide isomerase